MVALSVLLMRMVQSKEPVPAMELVPTPTFHLCDLERSVFLTPFV